MDNFRKHLKEGMWILMPYGYQDLEFCILAVTDNRVLLGRSNWLVTDAIWFHIDKLEQIDGEFLGVGKKKWYRFFSSLIFPYTEPKQWINSKI